MRQLFVTLCLSLVLLTANAQVKSGPMVGYSTMREVLLWVQTEAGAEVYFKYYPLETPKETHQTEKIKTTKKDAYVAKIIADEVMPGKKYQYEVFVNNKKVSFTYPLAFQSQTLWQYRTDPPAFKFAVGSCTYLNEPAADRPGRGYGNGYNIFSSIYKSKPDFMLWTGDNVYLREPDWNDKTGIRHRYNQLRQLPELQPLWANTHHYATWDDHDYGPNDADRTYWNKDITRETFQLFWGNPNYVWQDEAVTGTYFWEDCQFFLMDDRSFRAPNYIKDKAKDYFGQKQEDWLIESLASSSAPFKFVVTGGQVINPVAVFENMSTFPDARERLLRRIEEQNISGVVFITGDRHSTVLQKLDRQGTYPLYDFTISPLTSGMATPTEQEMKEAPMVEGTLVNKENNYAMMEVLGKRTDRQLKVTVLNAEGNELWKYTINARDLRKGKD